MHERTGSLAEDPSDGELRSRLCANPTGTSLPVNSDRKGDPLIPEYDPGDIKNLLSTIDFDICKRAERPEFSTCHSLCEAFQIGESSQKKRKKKASNSIEHVIINFSPVNHAPGCKSIVGWTDISYSTTVDAKSSVYSFFKSAYTSIKPSISVSMIGEPHSDSFNAISSIRKEFPDKRIIFHHVGYGIPAMQPGTLWASDGEYPIGALFQRMKPPSLFIFDCDNAASALPGLQAQTNKLVTYADISLGEGHALSGPPPAWDDWYCLCATGVGESLPVGDRIPSDFLSSCLLSPVETALLCHINMYYSIRFPGDCSMTKIVGLLHPDETTISTLCIIAEAVAISSLNQNIFFKLFRKDKQLAILYRNFVIAQYLLSKYLVTPVSHPPLPQMSNNPLWKLWDSTADEWIISSSANISRSSDIFSKAVEEIQKQRPSKGLILVLSRLVLMDHDHSKTALTLLSSLSNYDSALVSKVIPFNEFLSLSLTQRVKGSYATDLFKVLLVTALPNEFYTSESMADHNLVLLISIFFNTDLPEEARSYCAALICLLLPHQRTLKNACSMKSFFQRSKLMLSASKHQLQSWILRIIASSQFDPYNATIYGLHIQIASMLVHPHPSVRSAAILALSVIDLDDPELLILSVPALTDMSTQVRLGLLIYVFNFLSVHKRTYLSQMNNKESISLPSFSAMLSHWIGWKVTWSSIAVGNGEFIRDTFEACEKRTTLNQACHLASMMLHFLAKDPFPHISDISNRAIKSFDVRGGTRFEVTDLEKLSKTLIRKSVDELLQENRKPCASPQPRRIEKVDFLLNSELRVRVSSNSTDISNPAFISKSHSGSMTIADVKGCVSSFNSKLDRLGYPRSFSERITDLHLLSFHSEPLNLACLADGCVTIWQPESGKDIATWRADPTLGEVRAPLLAAPSYYSPFVLTARARNSASFWDLAGEQLVGDWKVEGQFSVSSIVAHPSDSRLFLLGSDGARFGMIDTRMPEFCHPTHNLSSRVTSISGSRANGNHIFIECTGGMVFYYDMRSGPPVAFGDKRNKYKGMIPHLSLPFMLVPSDEYAMALHTIEGEKVFSFERTDPNSLYCLDLETPTVGFCSSSGIIETYDFY